MDFMTAVTNVGVATACLAALGISLWLVVHYDVLTLARAFLTPLSWSQRYSSAARSWCSSKSWQTRSID